MRDAWIDADALLELNVEKQLRERLAKRRKWNLLLLIGVFFLLLYLYFYLEKPPRPVKPVTTEGITHIISIYGFGKERLKSPDGVAVDRKTGNIYVSDTGNHRGLVFDSRGRFLFKFGERKVDLGIERKKLFFPLGLDVAPNGDIYVASAMASQVSVFDKRGRFKKEIVFDRPIRIKIYNDKLYVTTPGQIWITDLKGKVLKRWGSKGKEQGQFEFPNGIDIDGQGNIFVSDSENMRIQILDKKGRLVGGVGEPPKSMSDADRLFGLGAGLVLDRQERVYVADAFHHAIRVFSHDGDDLGEFGKEGTDDGMFRYPSDMAYMGRDTFVIADKWNDRIQVLKITPPDQRPAAVSRRLPWWPAVLLLLLVAALWLFRRRATSIDRIKSGH